MPQGNIVPFPGQTAGNLPGGTGPGTQPDQRAQGIPGRTDGPPRSRPDTLRMRLGEAYIGMGREFVKPQGPDPMRFAMFNEMAQQVVSVIQQARQAQQPQGAAQQFGLGQGGGRQPISPPNTDSTTGQPIARTGTLG